MVYLTRGIVIFFDPLKRCVQSGGAAPLALDAVRFKLWVTLAGRPDGRTGMLLNVAHISRIVRDSLAAFHPADASAISLLRGCLPALKDKFPGFDMTEIELELENHIRTTLRVGDEEMVEVTVFYELAASHCLRNRDWDERRNTEEFGRCSNPAGHGHNYRLEVTLRGKPDHNTGQLASVGAVDQIVRENIVQRFDHKNLNADCPEFRNLMPTVENMARVFWELLDGKFTSSRLQRVRVWETANTCADYYGPAEGELRFSDRI
jgi:6-pyruvoyltetrahydropterin/6-carboxytetrahydropterin synthase